MTTDDSHARITEIEPCLLQSSGNNQLIWPLEEHNLSNKSRSVHSLSLQKSFMFGCSDQNIHFFAIIVRNILRENHDLCNYRKILSMTI